jgi:hypothetical protein
VKKDWERQLTEALKKFELDTIPDVICRTGSRLSGLHVDWIIGTTGNADNIIRSQLSLEVLVVSCGFGLEIVALSPALQCTRERNFPEQNYYK